MSTTATATATATRQQFLTVGTKGQGMTTRGRSTRGTTHDHTSKKSKKGTKGSASVTSGSLSNQDILEDLTTIPTGLITFLIGIILPCATIVGCLKLKSPDRRQKLWATANLILGIGFVFIFLIVLILYLVFEIK